MNESSTSSEKVVIIWDVKTKQSVFLNSSYLKTLYETYKIKAEGIGTPFISRKQNKLLGSPFFLTKYETLYLIEKSREIVL